MDDGTIKPETAEYYDTHDVSGELADAEWTRQEGTQPGSAMSGFSTRLPVGVLNDARAIARSRGMTTGSWIREVIEAAVARHKTGDDLVPLSVLLAAAQEYRNREAS
jgi:hypothetical protein